MAFWLGQQLRVKAAGYMAIMGALYLLMGILARRRAKQKSAARSQPSTSLEGDPRPRS